MTPGVDSRYLPHPDRPRPIRKNDQHIQSQSTLSIRHGARSSACSHQFTGCPFVPAYATSRPWLHRQVSREVSFLLLCSCSSSPQARALVQRVSLRPDLLRCDAAHKRDSSSSSQIEAPRPSLGSNCCTDFSFYSRTICDADDASVIRYVPQRLGATRLFADERLLPHSHFSQLDEDPFSASTSKLPLKPIATDLARLPSSHNGHQ